MLIVFVTLTRIRTRFCLISSSFVIKFGLFETLSVTSAWMKAFESLLGVLWAIVGARNGALGLLVDHFGLSSALIWIPKVDKMFNNCTKVSMKSTTKEVTSKKCTQDSPGCQKVMFRLDETHVFKNHTYPGNVIKIAPKCFPNPSKMDPRALKDRHGRAKRCPKMTKNGIRERMPYESYGTQRKLSGNQGNAEQTTI